MQLTGDFETTTDPDDCRVWAWGVCDIFNNDYFIYGNSLETFMEYCATEDDNHTIHIHNLKFDGNFIIYWLLSNGYTHSRERKLYSKEFSTLISDKNVFYSITICFARVGSKLNKVTFYCSMKVLPFSVDAIAKSFKLPISKLKIDYKEYREPGHELTPDEIAYLRNDVSIMAQALYILHSQGLTKITIGSNALTDYKKIITKEKFEKWFPVPNYDVDIRQSYKGGFCYLRPIFKDVNISEGITLDVNSLYPSVMAYNKLPYGEGIFYEGKYQKDEIYNLYVQMFTCNFILKPNHIPTIQLKNNLSFIPTEYIESSNDEDITLCLTSVDLKLFFDHYDVYNITWLSGWKFKSVCGLFTEYIEKWSNTKIQAKQDKNDGLYTIAKLMLNNLYGKFALNGNVRSKIPVFVNGEVQYILTPKEHRQPIYIPVGTFITAWARYKTITSAQKVFDRFIYADTDSLHLCGTEIPQDLEIDDYKLGAWKHEHTFYQARFLRQKSYVEYFPDEKQPGNDMHVTCAGMPKSCYQYVTWENFHEGLTLKNARLQHKKVKGGVVLVDRDFSIK